MVERGYLKRLWVNRIILTLCYAAASIAIAMLLLILGYTLFKGVSFINLDFITQAAKPVGEAGGGMRNEILGTFVLIAIGSIIAIPVGLMSGIYLSEFSISKCLYGYN